MDFPGITAIFKPWFHLRRSETREAQKFDIGFDVRVLMTDVAGLADDEIEVVREAWFESVAVDEGTLSPPYLRQPFPEIHSTSSTLRIVVVFQPGFKFGVSFLGVRRARGATCADDGSIIADFLKGFL